MTESQLREQVLAVMQGFVGCREANGSHKKILDIYNGHKPLPRGVKMLTTYAWCAATASAAFIKAGLTDIGFVECSCAEMIKLYKAKGRWMETDSYTPEPGDLIMYDWDDTGKGDCTGAPEHVGMVVSVSGKTIRVIEGNKNDAVGYRNLAVNGKYIRGYCLPDFAGKAAAMSAKPAVKQEKVKVDAARYFNRAYSKTFTVTAPSLNLRAKAGTKVAGQDVPIIKALKKGAKVRCYGYYSRNGETFWLYVKDADGDVGFCSKKYLE